MGGTIWCESEEGRGSRFSFTCLAGDRDGVAPLTPSAPLDSPPPFPARGHTEPTLQHRMSSSESAALFNTTHSSPSIGLPAPLRFALKVVLLSHNATLRHSLASTLHAWGCTVYASSDVTEVQRFIAKEQMDLLLADYETSDVHALLEIAVVAGTGRSQSLCGPELLVDVRNGSGTQSVGLPPAPPLIGGTSTTVLPPSIAFLLNLERDKQLNLPLPSHKKIRKPIKQSDLVRVLAAADINARRRLHDLAASDPSTTSVDDSHTASSTTPTRCVSAPLAVKPTRASTQLSRQFPVADLVC